MTVYAGSFIPASSPMQTFSLSMYIPKVSICRHEKHSTHKYKLLNGLNQYQL